MFLISWVWFSLEKASWKTDQYTACWDMQEKCVHKHWTQKRRLMWTLSGEEIRCCNAFNHVAWSSSPDRVTQLSLKCSYMDLRQRHLSNCNWQRLLCFLDLPTCSKLLVGVSWEKDLRSATTFPSSPAGLYQAPLLWTHWDTQCPWWCPPTDSPSIRPWAPACPLSSIFLLFKSTPTPWSTPLREAAGLMFRQVKVYTSNGVEEESAESFWGEMRI